MTSADLYSGINTELNKAIDIWDIIYRHTHALTYNVAPSYNHNLCITHLSHLIMTELKSQRRLTLWACG